MFSREEGSALLVVIILIIVVLGLGTAILTTSLGGLKTSNLKEAKLKSFYAAEAGIEEVRGRLGTDGSSGFNQGYGLPQNPNQGFVTISQGNLGEGEYTYTLEARRIEEGRGAYEIRSTGRYKDSQSIIMITVSELINKFREEVDGNAYHLVGNLPGGGYPWNSSEVNINDYNDSNSTLSSSDTTDLFNFNYYKHRAMNRPNPPGQESDEASTGRAFLNRGDESLELGETRFQNYFDSNNSGSGAVDDWHPENMNQLSGVHYVETDTLLDSHDKFHMELKARDFMGRGGKPAVIVINGNASIDIESNNGRKLDNIYFIVNGNVYINSYGSEVETGKDTFVYATGNISGRMAENNWNGVLATPNTINLANSGTGIEGSPRYNPRIDRVNWNALTVDGRGWGPGVEFYRRIIYWEQIR